MKKIAGSNKEKTKNKSSKNEKNLTQQRSKKKKISGPSNTGPIFYFSNKYVKKACAKEKNSIQNHCSENKEKSQKEAKSSKVKNTQLGKISDKVQSGLESLENSIKSDAGYDYKRTKNNGWIEDHCHGLWIKPQGIPGEFDKFKGELKKIEQELNKEIIDILKDAGGKVVDMTKSKMIDFAEKAAIREGAAMVSLAIPIVGEVVVVGATIWTVVDGVWNAGKALAGTLEIGKQALEKYKELAPQFKKIEELLSGKLTPSTVLADMMTVLATTNPCIQAKRCSLVRFDQTEGKSLQSSGKVQANSGTGCCPGQTGHHVLPGAMFDLPENPCGKKYEHSKAPVICLEGTNNNVGSHGIAHTALEKKIEAYKKSGADTISYKEACTQGIDAVRQINPLCSEKCLQAQLDAYYKNELDCKKNSQLKPNAGKAEKKTTPISAPTKSTQR